MTVDGGDGIKAVSIREPTDAAASNTGQTPAHVVLAPQFHLFRDEQAQKGPADISKAYDREVIGRNGSVSFAFFDRRNERAHLRKPG